MLKTLTPKQLAAYNEKIKEGWDHQHAYEYARHDVRY